MLFPEDIQRRLKRAAEAAFLLDEEMSQIRLEIQEAQFTLLKKKGLKGSLSINKYDIRW